MAGRWGSATHQLGHIDLMSKLVNEAQGWIDHVSDQWFQLLITADILCKIIDGRVE